MGEWRKRGHRAAALREQETTMVGEVQLRQVVDSDLPIFFAHQQEPEGVQMAAFTAADPSDRAAFDAHWARIRGRADIVLRTIVCDGTVIGHLARFERDGTPEVTYWLGRDHWGRGLATRALRAFLDELQPDVIYARAAADNVASRRVLEKCGFSVVAHERGFAHARGAEIDEVVLERRS
jgi:RimJ/RimL family protein N-acetyltransferase